jgi:hypothetical protein
VTVRLVSGETAHQCGGLSRERCSSRRFGLRGADALRRGRIGITMKPLIGYGSDMSARTHDLSAIGR